MLITSVEELTLNSKKLAQVLHSVKKNLETKQRKRWHISQIEINIGTSFHFQQSCVWSM